MRRSAICHLKAFFADDAGALADDYQPISGGAAHLLFRS
jgi:hypothetical protein